MALAAWEAAVLALPASRPIKPLLLDLAFNNEEELSFAGTPMRTNEVELLAAGLPSTRILETFGAALVALDISRCNITSKGVQLFGAGLVANDTLRKVWLNSNPLGPAGIRAISAALMRNNTLLSINLSNTNMIRGKKKGRNEYDHLTFHEDLTGVEGLAEAVSVNSSLTRLNIAKNGIGAHGLEILMPAVRHNVGLRSLSLAMNCKGSDAILFVSRAVKSSRTLRKIDLRSNPVGVLGAEMLAQAVKRNRSLTHLNLRNASIDLKALKVLKTAIAFSDLWTLDLSYNSLGCEGAHMIAKVLPKCSLTALNLSNCFLTDRGDDLSGAAALCAALEHNRSIAALDLSNNQLVKTSFRSFDDRSDDYSVTFALGRAMANNQVLLRVDLSANAIKKRGQVAIIEALGVSPCGLRFAPHIKRCLDKWFERLMKKRNAEALTGTGVSRYPPASLRWAVQRVSRYVFEALQEERQIMF